MLRLTGNRQALGATVREPANYGAAALVFGEFVGDKMVSWRVMLAGVAIWFVFVAGALALERE